MSDPRDQIEKLIRKHGGKLVRRKKHLVYKFPDGSTFALSRRPSDFRANNNRLAELRRLLRITPTKEKA